MNINIDTKKVDVKITRKDGVTDVQVDTPKVDTHGFYSYLYIN